MRARGSFRANPVRTFRAPPRPEAVRSRIGTGGRLCRAVLGALALVLAFAVLSDAAAQDKKSRSPAPARTEEETALLETLDKNQLVGARRMAEELLAEHPDSMVGHYVFGRVLHESEGNLPLSMYHLGKSREIYEATWDPRFRPVGSPWEFHRQLLYTIQAVAGQMEEHEYQLEILDYYDKLYQPDLEAEHAWPLLQLHRVKDARRVARNASKSNDPQQRSLGLNTLCAIEGEAGEREAYYKACRAAYDHAAEQEAATKKELDQQHESTLAVHAYNAARAAQANFMPDEGEKLALEGTARLAFTPANPWQFLVERYTESGKLKDAVDALRDMQRWRTRQPPHVRDQVRAETDVVFGTVLLLAAETERALRLVDLALERPDRRGLTTATPQQALGAHALLRRALRRTHAELLAEEATWTRDPARLRRVYDAFERRASIWADEERIIQVLSDEERLHATFRVYTRGGIEPVPVWLLGDLVDVLGPGVVAAVLDDVRAHEPDEAKPYLDALGAEVAFEQGDDEEALALAEKALEGLPQSEALLRARTAAVASQAADDAGKAKTALSYLEQAMQLDASVVRRLGLRIPCRITGGSSGTGELVRAMLEESPRLDVDEPGFEVILSGDDRTLSVCLHGPTGGKLSCATAPKAEPTEDGKEETDEQYASRVVEAFHKRALAMPLGLSATDLSSLDGSTTVAEQAAREKLGEILDEAGNNKHD
jgi:hypothetical protein